MRAKLTRETPTYRDGVQQEVCASCGRVLRDAADRPMVTVKLGDVEGAVLALHAAAERCDVLLRLLPSEYAELSDAAKFGELDDLDAVKTMAVAMRDALRPITGKSVAQLLEARGMASLP